MKIIPRGFPTLVGDGKLTPQMGRGFWRLLASLGSCILTQIQTILKPTLINSMRSPPLKGNFCRKPEEFLQFFETPPTSPLFPQLE